MAAPKKFDEKKTRWELRKDAACCSDQILEAAFHKTAAIRLLTLMVSEMDSKTTETSWRS